MLKPPFSRAIVRQPPSTLSTAHESQSTPITTAIYYALPTAFPNGNTLIRSVDDPDTCYATELRPERLDKIRSYLWLAGRPSCGRPLHRQQLLGREITITEDPNEHLVWHKARVFIKPLPVFLLDLDCWTLQICKSRQLHEAACGLLLSYAWLVRYPSDLRIAHEKGLLPDSIQWAAWTDFVNEFLHSNPSLQSMIAVSPRYQYGELRLSRLNKINFITNLTWRDLLRGYMSISTWYEDFFARNFAWLLAIFAIISVALSAMQVVLATTKSSRSFEEASYGFSIFSLFSIACTTLIVLLVWTWLFVYHLVSSQDNNRNATAARKSFADSQGGTEC